MSGKQLPPPAGGGDLAALLRRRHQAAPATTPGAEPKPQPASSIEVPVSAEATKEPAGDGPAPPATVNAAAAARTGQRPRGQVQMDRRSWYMPRESAEALSAAVEDLHWQTRRPKHEVLAALVSVALVHLNDVPDQLKTNK